MERVVSFYRFFAIENAQAQAHRLEQLAQRLNLTGTILVANEGVNATLCGEPSALREFVETCGIAELKPTYSGVGEGTRPFRRLRVRVRPEIVTFGDMSVRVAGCHPEASGTHLTPEQWHAWLDRAGTRVIDVRNRYELKLGSFPGAINPGTDSFTEFRDFVEQELGGDRTTPVAMYCTGGIRCEKAAAWMSHLGFTEVAQLQGGILGYFSEVNPSDNRFEGRCFVFDDRVSLTAQLEQGDDRLCLSCGEPIAHAVGSGATQCGDCALG